MKIETQQYVRIATITHLHFTLCSDTSEKVITTVQTTPIYERKIQTCTVNRDSAICPNCYNNPSPFYTSEKVITTVKNNDATLVKMSFLYKEE